MSKKAHYCIYIIPHILDLKKRTLVVNLQKIKEKETVLKAKEERQITIH